MRIVLPVSRLKLQKFLLYIKSDGVSGEATVRAYHPVAWNNDLYRVSVACPARGSRGVRVARKGCYISVSSGFSVRDAADCRPNFFLKSGAGRRYGNIKKFSCSIEIFLYLPRGFTCQRAAFFAVREILGYI